MLNTFIFFYSSSMLYKHDVFTYKTHLREVSMHMNIFNLLMYVSSGHGSSVMSVVFSRDGKIIVSGSMDKSVKIWDMETGDVAEETQDFAVNVDETAMLRAEIAKNLQESLKKEEELLKKDEELQKQRMEIANLKQTSSSESCNPTAVGVSIDRNELKSRIKEPLLQAWTSSFLDK